MYSCRLPRTRWVADLRLQVVTNLKRSVRAAVLQIGVQKPAGSECHCRQGLIFHELFDQTYWLCGELWNQPLGYELPGKCHVGVYAAVPCFTSAAPALNETQSFTKP